MNTPRNWRSYVFGDVGILIWLALARFVLQLFVNGQYGFHRDELGVIDNARYLAWGYVEYPPFTPAVVRVALELFGTGLVGVRVFAALGQSVVMVLAGLMARDWVAGAVNLYGPAHGLPEAISGINTYWLRGYGDFPPAAAILLGFDMGDAYRVFRTCTVAGQTPNPFKVENEETTDHPNILLCREPLVPWPELWPKFHWFG